MGFGNSDSGFRRGHVSCKWAREVSGGNLLHPETSRAHLDPFHTGKLESENVRNL